MSTVFQFLTYRHAPSYHRAFAYAIPSAWNVPPSPLCLLNFFHSSLTQFQFHLPESTPHCWSHQMLLWGLRAPCLPLWHVIIEILSVCWLPQHLWAKSGLTDFCILSFYPSPRRTVGAKNYWLINELIH